jgi:hypothetical protein
LKEPDRFAEEGLGELHGKMSPVGGSPDGDVLDPAIGNDAEIRLLEEEIH